MLSVRPFRIWFEQVNLLAECKKAVEEHLKESHADGSHCAKCQPYDWTSEKGQVVRTALEKGFVEHRGMSLLFDEEDREFIRYHLYKSPQPTPFIEIELIVRAMKNWSENLGNLIRDGYVSIPQDRAEEFEKLRLDLIKEYEEAEAREEKKRKLLKQLLKSVDRS